MKVCEWSCVFGLLCMPAEVVLQTWTVSQDPHSVSHLSVKSSARITCSTSLSNPVGLYLNRYFDREKDVLYLSLQDGLVTKNVTAPQFRGRIEITPERHRSGFTFTLDLDLLVQDDTDLYYCTWSCLTKNHKKESQSSNGTLIIVREWGSQELCNNQIQDLFLIIFIVATSVFLICIAALIVRYRKFRRTFRPSRDAIPPRPENLLYICPLNRSLQRPQHLAQHKPRHCHYMTTSADTLSL
ncbi:uncharacterized protein LOC115060221 [Echeneis naucrates]|uniref:uncharacterized protein LOC115060221 n=1 Tax=Echeneis naucrates TaxID=173247 RepID=UPI001113622B|nr:uncharacterized protein LOC115060221 [Echeneis naucrates]